MCFSGTLDPAGPFIQRVDEEEIFIRWSEVPPRPRGDAWGGQEILQYMGASTLWLAGSLQHLVAPRSHQQHRPPWGTSLGRTGAHLATLC